MTVGTKRKIAVEECVSEDFAFSSILELTWFEFKAGSNSLPMAPIVFNFSASLRDHSSVCFERSFYFIGSKSKANGGLLEVMFLGLLDGTSGSFTSFIASNSLETIMNDSQPFFIGYFLHRASSSALNIGFQKTLLGQVAPVVVHLSQCQGLSGCNVAEWSLIRNDSSVLRIHTQKQRFIVHSTRNEFRHVGLYVLFNA
jgi:hypothetical protein